MGEKRHHFFFFIPLMFIIVFVLSIVYLTEDKDITNSKSIEAIEIDVERDLNVDSLIILSDTQAKLIIDNLGTNNIEINKIQVLSSNSDMCIKELYEVVGSLGVKEITIECQDTLILEQVYQVQLETRYGKVVESKFAR